MKLFLTIHIVIFFAWSACAQSDSIAIIPYPKTLTLSEGNFELNASTKILVDGPCMAEAQYLCKWLSDATSQSFTAEIFSGKFDINYILLHCIANINDTVDISWLPLQSAKTKRQTADEDYKLIAKQQGIVVHANSPAGIFYAIQTLRQIIDAKAEKHQLQLPTSLPCVIIDDKSQFQHRGLLLDCCRHFMSVDFVKQTIDLIAQYKMNVLHWHLTEDQGWRIQIDKYPKLTEVGAWRIEADGAKYGGYYTKQEIQDIVAYAVARHVTIIPEIELPGHSVAAIAAYPVLSCTGENIAVENEWGVFKDIYCAGDDYTFEFLEDVLTEVCELFPGSYIHIGGDEASKYRWEHCPKCQKRIADRGLKNEHELQTYFIERIASFLATKNKKIIGWDEIMEGGMPKDAAVQSWRGMQGGIDAAQAHHYVIMSPTSHCYFDYPLESTDLAEVYSFNPLPDSLTNAEQQYVLGGECNMWTEHAPQELVYSKIFPRLIALSEVLWTPTKNLDYNSFQRRLAINYAHLDAQNVTYGFESIPFTLQSETNAEGKLVLTLKAANANTILTYQLVEEEIKMREAVTPQVVQEKTLFIHYPSTLYVSAEWNGKRYPSELVRAYNPHKALDKKITLDYSPSSYYPASGNGALVDGALGSSSFRDGVWQGVSGQNMEVVVDLEVTQTIRAISSNWFHYGNAWIFRPSKVEYYTSVDGEKWILGATASASLDDKVIGERITSMHVYFEKTNARYVKMIAYNYGPCPEWHDAVGEPSWLFCDELIVE